MFLAHYWRSQEQSLTSGKDLLSDQLTSNTTETDLAIWCNEKFAGFWSLYFPVATSVSYLFFFGIGGYLHVSTLILKQTEKWNNIRSAGMIIVLFMFSSLTMWREETLLRSGNVNQINGSQPKRKFMRYLLDGFQLQLDLLCQLPWLLGLSMVVIQHFTIRYFCTFVNIGKLW